MLHFLSKKLKKLFLDVMRSVRVRITMVAENVD